MSIFSRARLVFRIKSNAALDQLEHPLEAYDYADVYQQDLLRKVGQGLIEVGTSRQRLRRQAEQLGKLIPVLVDQAQRALDAEREDLARTALQRKQAALTELSDLEAHLADMAEDERTLKAAHQQLTTRIAEFRHQRVLASARYQSASARVSVSESLTGVSGELAELSMAVGRAEEKTERLQARASAIDALIASGTLSTPLGYVDTVERSLREIASERAIEEELKSLRANSMEAPEPSEGAEDREPSAQPDRDASSPMEESAPG